MEPRNSPSSNAEDRISNLPETLIHHILSFNDMKYAVQTSVLSRRWRHIWKSLPILNLDDGLFASPTKRHCFIDFVDMVFNLRDSSDIQGFHFLCYSEYSYRIRGPLHTWIVDAVRCNVREFSLDIYGDPLFQFPECLFTCKSLTKLKLEMGGMEYSKIILPDSMSLPRLKYLKLGSVSICDERLTDKLFSSCPALESLILVDTCVTDSDMNLNISSLKLKHFKYGVYESEVNAVKTVKLCAPNLTSFSCKDYVSQDYSLESLSSLVTADINMILDGVQIPELYSTLLADEKELYGQRMMRFLRALYNVKDLTLSYIFLQVISGAPEIFDRQPPQFCNLQCLKLKTWLSIDCFHAIIYLLKISPNIESLSLVIAKRSFDDPPMYPFYDEIKFDSGNAGDYWEAGLSLPCMLQHLKIVKIQEVLGCVNELKFLEILFKNSIVLEKVILFSSISEQNSRRRERRMMKFSEKLLTFPRASASTVILFRF